MKSPLLAFLLIAVFGAGWWFGHRSVETPPPAVPAESPREEETERLLRDAAQDINAAADPGERARKVDELLEKIFKLFLIEVSLRLADSKPPVAPTAPPPPAAEPSPPPAPPAPADPPARPPRELSETEQQRRRARVEARVVNADNPRTLRNALTELAGQDMQKSYGASKDFTPEQEKNMIGVWEGRIEQIDGSAPWSLRIEIKPIAASGGKEAYQSDVLVTKSGRSVSHSSGRGSLKGFSSSPDGSAIYIEAGGDVMELYFSKTFDGLVGLFYKAESRAQFKPTGRIRLERRGG